MELMGDCELNCRMSDGEPLGEFGRPGRNRGCVDCNSKLAASACVSIYDGVLFDRRIRCDRIDDPPLIEERLGRTIRPGTRESDMVRSDKEFLSPIKGEPFVI
jgi:hypothetical protein